MGSQHVNLGGLFDSLNETEGLVHGHYMTPEAACRIGMIPPCLTDRIHSVGNAAGEGEKLCALSRAEYEYAKKLTQNTEFLELASDPEFQDVYVDALEFSEGEQ